MAIGPIEIQGSVTRLQDFAIQKHNEDTKVVSEQAQVVSNIKEDAENRANSVNRSEDPENNQNKFDAREKGSNEYSRNEGKKKKEEKESEGKVLLKGNVASFDIRI